MHAKTTLFCIFRILTTSIFVFSFRKMKTKKNNIKRLDESRVAPVVHRRKQQPKVCCPMCALHGKGKDERFEKLNGRNVIFRSFAGFCSSIILYCK